MQMLLFAFKLIKLKHLCCSTNKKSSRRKWTMLRLYETVRGQRIFILFWLYCICIKSPLDQMCYRRGFPTWCAINKRKVASRRSDCSESCGGHLFWRKSDDPIKTQATADATQQNFLYMLQHRQPIHLLELLKS
jgi:hypothetical protein